MEVCVRFDSQNVQDLKVDIKGFKEEVDLSNPEELFFNSSTIVMAVVDGVVNEIAKSAPPDKKKELAEMIVDDVKKMIGMYYDDMDKAYKEREQLSDMYADMVEWYEHVLDEYDIDEEKLVEQASDNDGTLDVVKDGDNYLFKIKLGEETYTIGKISSLEEDKVIEVEAFKASMFVTVLYDNVYSDDTSENPFRQAGMFNPFSEVLRKKVWI